VALDETLAELAKFDRRKARAREMRQASRGPAPGRFHGCLQAARYQVVLSHMVSSIG